jgi:hypothetical protein
MLDLELKLSDWVFNAIRANEVLTHAPRLFPAEKAARALDLRDCAQAL